MHPYPRFAGLPPEGEVLVALSIGVLMSSNTERRVKFPPSGVAKELDL